MIVTTTPGIEGRNVSDYLGVVVAQGVLGVNVFKDVAAGMQHLRRSLTVLRERAGVGGERFAHRAREAGPTTRRRRGDRRGHRLRVRGPADVDGECLRYGRDPRLTFAVGLSGADPWRPKYGGQRKQHREERNEQQARRHEENAAIIAHPTCRARRASTCCGRSIPKMKTSAPPTPRTDIARKIRWRVSANDVNTRTPRRTGSPRSARPTTSRWTGFRGRSPHPLRHRTPSAWPRTGERAPSG